MSLLTLNSIPLEVVVHVIMPYLSLSDFLIFRLVSTRFNNAAKIAHACWIRFGPLVRVHVFAGPAPCSRFDKRTGLCTNRNHYIKEAKAVLLHNATAYTDALKYFGRQFIHSEKTFQSKYFYVLFTFYSPIHILYYIRTVQQMSFRNS
jgi:hypothetical protein